MAVVTAAVRSSTCSFSNTRSRWLFTVASPMPRLAARSRRSRRRAPPASTSCSRGVERRPGGGPARRPGQVAAAAGARTVSPRAAARTAGDQAGARGVLEQVAGGPGLDTARRTSPSSS